MQVKVADHDPITIIADLIDTAMSEGALTVSYANKNGSGNGWWTFASGYWRSIQLIND